MASASALAAIAGGGLGCPSSEAASAAAALGVVTVPVSGGVATAVGHPPHMCLHTTSAASAADRAVAPSGGSSIDAATPRRYLRRLSSHTPPGTAVDASVTGARARASTKRLFSDADACAARSGWRSAPTSEEAATASPSITAAARAAGVGGAASAGARVSTRLRLRPGRGGDSTGLPFSSRWMGSAKSRSRNLSRNVQTSRTSPASRGFCAIAAANPSGAGGGVTGPRAGAAPSSAGDSSATRGVMPCSHCDARSSAFFAASPFFASANFFRSRSSAAAFLAFSLAAAAASLSFSL
mmetsp:Transcript_6641/g.27606  ORF Transcript_6641/g.27606 Transcript_6641/m.27606 type:complete len:297 (+) Transcript_6641:3534-4424(+)